MASDSPTNSFFKSNNSYDGPITSLTDSTGGTASNTIVQAAGANPTAAEFENNCASFAAKIEEILDVLREKGLIRS